jgi:adenylate cyclase
MCVQHRFLLSELPIIDVYLAREQARGGDRDAAIQVLRKSVDDITSWGQAGYYIPATGVLVETLLDRGAEGDLAEAETAIATLEAAPAEGSLVRDFWLLRLRALLAHARGDAAGSRELRDRYREMATSLRFEGHISWAEAMS